MLPSGRPWALIFTRAALTLAPNSPNGALRADSQNLSEVLTVLARSNITYVCYKLACTVLEVSSRTSLSPKMSPIPWATQGTPGHGVTQNCYQTEGTSGQRRVMDSINSGHGGQAW